jgi:hypothetical protein
MLEYTCRPTTPIRHWERPRCWQSLALMSGSSPRITGRAPPDRPAAPPYLV